MTNTGKTSAARPSPFRHLVPIAAGLGVGSVLYFGYQYFAHQKAQQQAAVAAQGDADMAKPTADECAIARVALTAVRATGSDKTWQAAAGVHEMSLATYSKVINTADVAGFTDDEARNLRSKAAADWRWCKGMGTFVSGLGWSGMGGEYSIAVLTLGRPGMSPAGDEARLYEAFMAPKPDTGVLKLTRGPWLVTLHRAANGAWQVASTEDLKRAY
ncbi:MAG TPA: hypothetical protein VFE13_14165 [Caulobacteraceae bacterium]|jgi:hypothetical protein|nr:hypothetical protein [Caulobacteraceae bacterium]